LGYSQGELVSHIHWVLAKPAVPGWEDIRQTISGHTFYYIYSGKGIFRRGEEDYIVEEGTLAYLRPGMPLYMKSSDTHPIRMTMMLFDCAMLRKVGNGWDPLKPVEQLQLPFLMHFHKDGMRIIGSLFHEAESEWVPGDPGSGARVKSVWYRLIQELHESAEAEWSKGQEEGLAVMLRRFKEKLDRGFASELRISELAAKSGFSPVYIRRTFTARFGCSPKEYLDRLRNEHAVRRLQYTGDSVTDIARVCGYQDVYQFSKAFKKRNGLSPTEYRRKQRTDS
jgi:AraC family transcriptional regulator